ncbi:MAG TPA: CHAD domain-containing protein [Anaeromyxobacter sp.]|nr:CHAD domain-containing protein [Anaeromyxobacter sp.]
MRLDPEILDGPPEIGARVLALARLADAEDAVAPLADPQRRDALPAFRAAVRRLAVALEAGLPALAGALAEGRVARVEASVPRSPPWRDADAVAGWLEGIRTDLPAPYRGALDWLLDRVERRRRAAAEEAAGEAARRFRRLAARLRDELTARPAPGRRPGAPATLALALAGALRARTRALREAVIALAGPDAAGLRRVREQAARLADLLEPLRAAAPKAADALDALRPLEDLLAAWHAAAAGEAAVDGALLEARAEEARRGAAAIAGLRPGLLALLRLARERAGAAWTRLAAEHLASRATPATDAAYAAAAALESPGEDEDAEAGPPTAPERRFLVTAIPPEGRGGDAEELEQGWLPGEARESVGVTRSPLGEQFFHARAPGRGRPGRIETIDRAGFEAFWPLTEGRRIAKRRHLVAAAPGWHFDEYLDRPLVLAVAEEGNAEEPPPWLEPVLVREVSAERGYLDEALARRPARRTG